MSFFNHGIIVVVWPNFNPGGVPLLTSIRGHNKQVPRGIVTSGTIHAGELPIANKDGSIGYPVFVPSQPPGQAVIGFRWDGTGIPQEVASRRGQAATRIQHDVEPAGAAPIRNNEDLILRWANITDVDRLGEHEKGLGPFMSALRSAAERVLPATPLIEAVTDPSQRLSIGTFITHKMERRTVPRG
ncbi:MAG: hypothetical protein DWQ47_17505 [Acidobacteria bacterium]|nr:MAG: hypothetical protein DWQ32_04905 [Acidobacteriota bacterium]REK02164.1 MAG: hypothetical protein DWQ38_07250 [Acidobacteriota bacterium]REK14034.1 MAG: hypothetical protein DWQ43_10595 [Acidobacteriota bacterium]REK42029.1 MAG: hypothetical protein DWQ47_17505 [Acidobacteriota bacterium]